MSCSSVPMQSGVQNKALELLAFPITTSGGSTRWAFRGRLRSLADTEAAGRWAVDNRRSRPVAGKSVALAHIVA